MDEIAHICDTRLLVTLRALARKKLRAGGLETGDRCLRG
jgi:hypothetical protein